MFKKYPYLSDKDFLKEVDESLVLTQYVRIILLNWKEQPIQNIEGRITGGTISINGDSSVRRTCNLSTFVDEDKYDYKSIDAMFSLNKKVIIEIGVNNLTDKYEDYPIIWFPQGQFVIMGLSLNHSTSGTTISLNLKDKMVLLNGECGGTFPASTTLDEMDEKDEATGEFYLKKVPIYQIIQEVVNHFGGIPISQILINDVDLQIRQVMKWTGDVPLYQYVYTQDDRPSYTYTTQLKSETPTKIFSHGDDVGYIYTDFVYPEELVAEAGQSCCDILDKIKSTLGNYEYFFDIYGNFVFQEKKNYLNTRQTTVQLQGFDYDKYLVEMKEGMVVYKFNNSQLITSISNNPKYDNIKNDFIVWGVKKTVEGNEYPIRYHLAIDTKPEIRKTPVYLNLYEDEYGTKKARLDEAKGTPIQVKDWRTEIYVRGLEAEVNVTDAPYYFLELDNEWRKMYDLENGTFTEDAINRPYELDFFLDFIDSDSALGQYSVQEIGRRTTVLVDDTINCLFEPEIPNVVFYNIDTEKDPSATANYYYARNENYCGLKSDIYDFLEVGGSMNSAFVAIRDLLYQSTNYNESVSIQMIPIFHLEPNTRINIVDDQSGIDGDFVITSINIPLDVNSTMSVSAIKALEKI